MERWLACTVLAAFILGDPAGAEEATGRDRYWIDAAALNWKIGDAPQPTPLVTAGSPAAPLPGALGQPGTSVQIGGTSVSLPTELGGRFALGTWVDRAAGLGIELGGFVLSPATTRQSVSTNGMPGSATYAVPLFDLSGFTSGGAPGQSIYVLPGPFPNGPGFTGSMQRTMSAQMVGAELVGVYRLHDDRQFKVEALAGYHWLQLTEVSSTCRRRASPDRPTPGRCLVPMTAFMPATASTARSSGCVPKRSTRASCCGRV
jgi:hypothetical protein